MPDRNDFEKVLRAASSRIADEQEKAARYCAAMIKAHIHVMYEVAETGNDEVKALAVSELDTIATMVRAYLDDQQ